MTDAGTYGLTTRARELLAVIREWKIVHGGVPTYRQMAEAVGIASISGIHRIVKQLEERGLIRRLDNKWQTIVLVEPSNISLPEDVALALRHAARAYGRSPDEHAAAVLRQHCQITPSPF